MVFASLTYLDSLNMYIALCSYKALTELSEKRLVSTEPYFHISFDKLKTECNELYCYLEEGKKNV
jgi:hypothetical protein